MALLSWPRGDGPSFLTSYCLGTVLEIETYEDDILTLPPANPKYVTIATRPNGGAVLQTGDISFNGRGDVSANYPLPPSGTHRFGPLPLGITSYFVNVNPNEPQPVGVTFTFPYEEGRTVSFNITGWSDRLGVGGMFTTGVQYEGYLPGVHYFADPRDYTHVYVSYNINGRSSYDQVPAVGPSFRPDQPIQDNYGISGNGIPTDYGFAIGGYQQDKQPWMFKKISFFAEILPADPATWAKYHPNEPYPPRRRIPIGGFGMHAPVTYGSGRLFGYNYDITTPNNEPVDNDNDDNKRTLTGDIGVHRGFFTGRNRP